TRGMSGQGLLLDGVHDFLSIEAARLLPSAPSFTVSLWANVHALHVGPQIIAARQAADENQREWALIIDDANHFRFHSSSEQWASIASQTIPRPGRWYHLAVSVDDGIARLHVDGILEAEGPAGALDPDSPLPLAL